MKVLETERLRLRWMNLDDAEFILRLVNDPSWLRFIGDRGIRTLEDARKYITTEPAEVVARLGFGLYIVELKGSATPIGICGLIKRDTLDDVDLGFALLPEFCGQGYALESAAAVVDFAGHALGLKRLVAITSLDNDASIRLLEKLDFGFERLLQLSSEAPALRLFGRSLPQ